MALSKHATLSGPQSHFNLTIRNPLFSICMIPCFQKPSVTEIQIDNMSLRNIYIRDRPFNLKGGGGMFFLFRSEFFFQSTQEIKKKFVVAQSAIFFPEFNIRLYDKNSESYYFFFPPPKSEYFFQQHWESEYFFRKKP